jgi:hypothetical protein
MSYSQTISIQQVDKSMTQFSTLKSMGLDNVTGISHHTLSTKDEHDILKVYFNDSNNTDHPDSCSFNFIHNSSDMGEAGRDTTLVAALNELNSLNQTQHTGQHQERLLDDLTKLEAVMAAKMKELREGVAQMN